MAKKAKAIETVEVAPQEVVTKTPPKPAKEIAASISSKSRAVCLFKKTCCS